MYTTIDEFRKAWKTESGNTKKLLEQCTDQSLSQAVADDHRTLGRIAWHIVTTICEMMSQTGLQLDAVKSDAPTPTTADAIRQGYASAADELVNQIVAKWDDKSLEIVDEMYGEKWKRSFTLDVLIRHEIHHRGQMSVLMRQAGLTPPGVYGPALEEWSAFGAKPPEV